MSYTSKITVKGQVTIPREIRKLLNSNIVEFEVAGERIVLKPVRGLGGSLSKYAKRPAPLSEIRDMVREAVIKEKHKR